ncbi:hypothetical protein [Polycladomyces subterraneus]|uniref:Uncharacterized protein n=1 Tax=Polycladomyces subterraneus TaxID=1016997 RepID=A0ABT8IQ37_9BACL|nr:hypothetical protein [Polycladomyces subterraneus]MDN4594631.1 hypothetical protein [Polycladomyces subterraneus]
MARIKQGRAELHTTVDAKFIEADQVTGCRKRYEVWVLDRRKNDNGT